MSAPSDRLNPFDALRSLTYDSPLPRLVPVRQKFDATRLDDVTAATQAALEPIRSRITPGMSVAITAGSRGIHDKPEVVKAAGGWLREAGAEPFVVPAMGSHGGATAEGQILMLKSLGMTEEYLGMEIRSNMDVIELGRVEGGPIAYMDKNAAAADAVLAVNRVKAHTDFKGEIESGLAKIIAIGLGKQKGAEGIHRFGPKQLGETLPGVARKVIGTGKILGGLAILENAYERATEVTFVEPDGIGAEHEKQLLAKAKDQMGQIPFDAFDVAVFDEMGKNVSGAGMDTNVLGRMMIRGTDEFERPKIVNTVVLDLTEPSHGNAVGIGLADFIPIRLFDKLDMRALYMNGMTSGLGGPQRCQIPMTFADDRSAISAAIATCGRPDSDNVTLVRMKNTLELEHLLVSESLIDQVHNHPELEITGEATDITFTEGVIDPWQM